MTSEESKTKMNSLIKKREKYFSRMQAIYDVGKKCLDLAQKKQSYTAEVDSFISRYQRLEDDYLVYEQVSEDITVLNSSVADEDKVEVHNASLAYDELYFNVKTLARKMKVDQQSQPPKPNSSADSQSPTPPQPQIARLPKLEIEPFDGSISAWPNFYALFTSMIHKNKSLSNSEKLTYLRSLLKSHALALIETLVICDENYEIAMQSLIQRYQNKRLLASNYLDKVISFRALNEDSSGSLSSFLEVFNTNLAALKALGMPDLFDFTMLHVGLRALTPTLRKDFENEYASSDIPLFENLIGFVQQQLKILEITSKNKPKASKPVPYSKAGHSKNAMLSTVNTMSTLQSKRLNVCPCCNDLNHKIYSCSKFKGLTTQERYEFVKKNSLCFCCLGHHEIAKCKSQFKCSSCNGKHHSLLHRPKPVSHSMSPSPNPPPSQVDKSIQDPEKSCNFANSNTSSNMMLSTAIIGVKDQYGKLQPVRAVIDGGSQTSLITQNCVTKLGLLSQKSNISLRALADTAVPINKGAVKCCISPLKNPHVTLSTDAIVVPKISTNQPNMYVDPSISSKFSHLQLADPLFYESSPIEFLLGADLYFDILRESHNIIKGQPSAMATIFGWIVGGKIPDSSSNECSYFLNCCESIDNSIKKFWEVESTQIIKPQNPEDIAAELQFTEMHKRDYSGRYIVPLPLKPDSPPLPDTRNQARNRLINLENRLKRDPSTFKEYRDFMDEYISTGHMSIALSPSPYVIPHHCVRNENSSTTKLRTVFNASFKPNASSSSLNDQLYSGPKLQKDISEIITNFRLHEIVVCADIKQMYRQIVVDSDYRKYQHIFYRTSLSGSIDEYELNVLTYGVTSSAYLAQRVLLQLVTDEGQRYPLASKAITDQTFVDDICASVDTPAQALQLQTELTELLSLGGFPLRKWASNCQQVLDKVPPDFRDRPLTLRADDSNEMKILGLQYDPSKDVFSYCIQLNTIVLTKRSMLSEIAKIYDVLGWITPVTFFAKSLMQQLWLLGLSWDDLLPPQISEKWTNFISTLPSLSQVHIPRFTPISYASLVQLIGFCDASQKGYAANLYLRTESTNGVQIHLIKGKSKVAPLKTMSIPRLELSAAQLLMETLSSTNYLMQSIEPKNIVLFTDSSIVLAWLSTPPYKLKTFVANRVVNILEGTQPSQWQHVSSKDNPCDCASKGLLPNDLVKHELWWNGPDFLYTPFEAWKSEFPSRELNTDLPEVKVESLFISSESINSIPLKLMENRSSLLKVQFILAMVLRFINNARCKKLGTGKLTGPISPKELNVALQLCVKSTQQCFLLKEITELRNGKVCSSKYRCLAPFVDKNGFLRVGGRLANSKLSESRKYPLLVPRSSRLATLICDYYHSIALHSGPRLTQSLIQNKFWIIGIRQLLRERIFKCQRCYMFQAKPLTPKMADLPAIRFENVRAFLNVGLDYAGPIEYKESLRRKAPHSKGYIVIFVCLSTKAVHLEFASSLSTPSFLAALDRFVARRGLCKNIYSDCGTNFQGAANYFSQLNEMLKNANQDISNHLAAKSIKWNFIPPAAPHFGGLWEAAVKSTKKHLVRVVGQLTLTLEEMYTLLTRIEAVLNSRPIGAMTTDPNDGDYLSPGHFLVGSPLLSPPESDYTSTQMNRLTRYQLLQQAAQTFWKSWSQDYLQTLMPRNKWNTQLPNMKKGDVVYLQLKNTSPLEWPIGRIEETFPGKDGVVRAAKIRTSQGQYVRPVHKLIPLPPPDIISSTTTPIP